MQYCLNTRQDIKTDCLSNVCSKWNATSSLTCCKRSLIGEQLQQFDLLPVDKVKGRLNYNSIGKANMIDRKKSFVDLFVSLICFLKYMMLNAFFPLPKVPSRFKHPMLSFQSIHYVINSHLEAGLEEIADSDSSMTWIFRAYLEVWGDI